MRKRAKKPTPFKKIRYAPTHQPSRKKDESASERRLLLESNEWPRAHYESEKKRARKEDTLQLLTKCYDFWHYDAFAQDFLPTLCPKPFGPHHHEIFAAFPPGARGVRRADAAPRGSGKTNAYQAIVIHKICYKRTYELLGYEPDDFIIIIGESTAGYKIAKNIAFQFEHNHALQLAFGYLPDKSSWSATERVTTNMCCLRPKKKYEQIRGENWNFIRPKFLWISDIQKPEHVESPLQRQRDMDLFDQDFANLADDDIPINIAVEGTILHQEAVLAQVLDKPVYAGKRHPAINSWSSREDLWADWKAIYTDIADPEHEKKSNQFFIEHKREMLDGTNVLWEDKLDYLTCMKKRVEIGTYAFEKEFQQNPEDETRQLFNMDEASYFSVVRDGLLREDGRLVGWNDLIGVSCFLDWAGGKDYKDTCYACIVIVAWEYFPASKESYRYVLDVWMDKKPPSFQISKCFDFLEKYSNLNFRLGIEAASLNGKIDEQLREAFNDEKERRREAGRAYDIIPHTVIQSVEKYTRISKLEPKVSNGWILFNRSLNQEFMTQLRLFPTHQYLDGPDALEGACQLVMTKTPRRRPERNRRKPVTMEF